ncbi:hypothetical protein [Halovivax cerinus]|uniref:Uncharacterized protein n=1 Tax=Halovivax cerinus TaxID=1487865 RepID=A0ABD5NKZ5_9EURY|nr:hypothetical protein [Halovivax cerinus]
MQTIEVTDEQHAYLEQVRSTLQDEVVGRYGTCRDCDAVQFLIDNFDDERSLSEAFDTDALVENGELRYTEDVSSTEPSDAGDQSDADGEDDSDAGGDGATDDEMLDEMMNLLDTHDDKWDESPSGDHRYRVELPDGGSEDVQTKDDVRAILFREYR